MKKALTTLIIGRMETVRRFCELTVNELGWDINGQKNGIALKNEGIEEVGHRSDTGAIVITIDPKYYRPNEVYELRGDTTKVKEILGWKTKISLEELIDEMVKSEFLELKNS